LSPVPGHVSEKKEEKKEEKRKKGGRGERNDKKKNQEKPTICLLAPGRVWEMYDSFEQKKSLFSRH
jgi:hypothetical protein